MSTEDPIIAEIRAIRKELSEQFGDDINALCEFLASREREHPQRLVNYPPKPPEVAAAAGEIPRKRGGGQLTS
jgi:hypothetical protein